MLLGYHSDGASYDVRGTLGAAPHFAASLKYAMLIVFMAEKSATATEQERSVGFF